jgi:CheY-like chemotaxis protein/cell division septation protein DedD
MASKTVLVIDADSETEQLIASTLESEGYLVFSVPGGDVGTEMAQKVSPSLIFINPDETGLEICKAIHEFESLKKVPIILLTSSGSDMDLRAGSAVGAADFLKIPFGSDELLEKTAKALDMKAPLVLHVKERDRAPELHESPVIQKSGGGEPDFAEMSGIAELDEEIKKKDRPDLKESLGYNDTGFSEEEVSPGKKKSKVLIAVACLVIVIAGTAGVLFYSGLIPGLGPQKAVPVKPQNIVQKPKAVVPAPSPAQSPLPSNEQQKQEPVVESKAVPPPPPSPRQEASVSSSPSPSKPVKKDTSTSSPRAASTNVQAAKPSGKTIYSVQLGVFKNEQNAAALTKQFKEKGYDAFMIKSTEKDKGTLYRVLAGKSEDKKESMKLLAKIRDKEKIKAFMFSE